MTTLPTVYKTRQMLEVEAAHKGQDIRRILIDLYNTLGTMTAVSEKLNVTQPTIQNWFEMLGIAIVTTTRAELKSELVSA